MYRALLALLLLLSSLVPDSMAQEQAIVKPVPHIRVTVLGDFDTEWVQALATYITDTLCVQATSRLIADAPEPSGTTIAHDLLGRFPATDENEIRLFLVDAPRLVDEPAINLLFAQDAAVINAAAWTPAPADHIAVDVWRARLDREFIFTAGRLLGMPACSLPLCALHDDISAGGIDLKARGPCPPCSDRLKEKLGIPTLLPSAHP